MLRLLSVSNFAVVSEASIELGDGLNLLTGETGSGKSIFVDALGLLLGGRASAEIVRGGESAALIQGVFDIDGNRDAVRVLAEAGIDATDGELIIRREITDRSRSRAFVNDQAVTIGLLRSLRPFLIDIHGQGDQQNLLYPETHVDVLDDFGGLQSLRAETESRYAAYSAARREADSLHRSESERLREIDILAFQVSEIQSAALAEHEDEDLERERVILANAERLALLTGEAFAMLYDDERSVVTVLGQIQRRIEQIAGLDSRFEPYVEQLQSAKFTLEDLAYYLRDYLHDTDFSPARLAEVDERIVEIERLKRKYGGTLGDVVRSGSEMAAELETLRASESRSAEITSVLTATKNAFLEKAHELSKVRRDTARNLAEQVSAELEELAMGATVFEVSLGATDSEDETRFGPKGIDRVEFLVATNPGEEPRSLSRIASGGETSRLMLALKTVSAPPEIPRTLVFDEVDVGIGGRVAEAVGMRLAQLGRKNQVLCVTHQAQIARFADEHFTVQKEIEGDRAVTRVEHLDRKGRVEELARMIGGADVSETARKHARELLKSS